MLTMQPCISPGFYTSILRHNKIGEAADEAALKKAQEKGHPKTTYSKQVNFCPTV